MQIQKVIGLAQRLFNTGTEIPKLAYISSKVREVTKHLYVKNIYNVRTSLDLCSSSDGLLGEQYFNHACNE